MKLALISHNYPTSYNPKSGKFVEDQFNLLNDLENFEVNLYVPTPYSLIGTERYKKNHSPFLEPGLNKIRLNYISFPERKFPKIVSRTLSKEATSVLSKTDYDIIHIHWLYPDGLMIPELKELGFRVVLTIHGSDWYKSISKNNFHSILEATLKSVDYIIFPGPKIKQDVEKKFPFVGAKSKIIFNAVDESLYKPISTEEKVNLQKAKTWNPQKNHALTIANLRYEKGVDLLIEAVSNVKRFEDVDFHIIGNAEDTPFSNEILDKLKHNQLKNIFLHPSVTPSELISYYQAADFYIMPSRRESFNISRIEAISCGLPIVSTNVSGIEESMINETGLLVNDTEELPDKIFEMSKIFKDYDPLKLHEYINELFGKKIFVESLRKTYALLV